jgi:extracellular factor (EF) 3-hydroxypalmitic acid methyl ester biosynthesis protein
MMSMLYSNSYCGNSTFEKLMHKHPVEHPGAQAVRNRRKFIAEAIPRIRSRWSFRSEEKMRILSVACGPACEIEDILLCSEDCAGINSRSSIRTAPPSWKRPAGWIRSKGDWVPRSGSST